MTAQPSDDAGWAADWLDGWGAFERGVLYGACPHSDADRRLDWQNGWRQSEVDKEITND